jgi:superfamily II DNA or RNA helicase
MAHILRQHQLEAVFVMSEIPKGIINLPTGTGKSLIQAEAIVSAIALAEKPGVYVIASPRILLSNQLLESVRDRLIERGIDCQYLCVRSGMAPEFGESETLLYRELKATTSSKVIKETYDKAQREGVPLIISAVYESVMRIDNADIPIDALHCDEAHFLVRPEFTWIPVRFAAKAMYFYTATLRVTKSDEGLGMNNEDRFGPVLYQRAPLDMVTAGEIVKPRMHIVNTSVPVEDGDTVDPRAIVESFLEHRSMVNFGAKLLVVTKGSEHLDAIVNSAEIQRLRRQRPSLTIFDISSKFEPRINGSVVTRNAFLSRLRGLNDQDEAIIFHIDILTEGIDVPGITGVMVLNDLGPAKFLQTLGRATRLHPIDRERLYKHEIKSSDTDEFVKPYAWVIVPSYGEIGDDLRDTIVEMVANLRTFGFNPSEDVVTKLNRGSLIPEQIGMINKKDTRAQALVDFFGDIESEIESSEEADRIVRDVAEAKTLGEALAAIDFED